MICDKIDSITIKNVLNMAMNGSEVSEIQASGTTLDASLIHQIIKDVDQPYIQNRIADHNLFIQENDPNGTLLTENDKEKIRDTFEEIEERNKDLEKIYESVGLSEKTLDKNEVQE